MHKIIGKTLSPILKFNFLKQFARDILIKRLIKFPEIVQIDTINVCNADCIMCPVKKSRRKKGTIDFDLYKEIIDQCAEAPKTPKEILPFLNGEPLLAPRLFDYIDYTRRKNSKWRISLYTNAALLDQQKALMLLESGLDFINISFDGVDKETYEKVRKNLSFEKVAENIQRFWQLRREKKRNRKPFINLSIIEMEETRFKLHQFVKEWEPWADQITVESLSNWGGEIGNVVQARKVPCPRLWHHIVILRNGDVALCCLDYDGKVILGNVGSTHIGDIWVGGEIRQIRKTHTGCEWDKIELCQYCNYPIYTKVPFWWWSR